MHKLKLLCLTALALFAFGAFAASAFATEAEEENNPRILVTEGKASELEATLKGANPALIQLSGEKTIKATSVTATIKGCENLSGHEKDTNLCKDQSIDFTGVKQESVNCRSENAKGEKDPVETVLALLDLHAVSQESTEKTLQPALQALVLGTALEEEVKFNCGTVKIQVKGKTVEGKAKGGVIECLVLPGLVTTKKVEVLCKVNATTHDATVGTCKVLCTDFGALGLEADLNGTEFKDSWEEIHLEGETNKNIFIDE
jgi:hypothetical protein